MAHFQLGSFLRQGAVTVCLVAIRGQTRKARIDESELDEGFQPYHPPFQVSYCAFPRSGNGLDLNLVCFACLFVCVVICIIAY